MTATASLPRLAAKDFLTIAALDAAELRLLLETASEIKRDPGRFRGAFAGRAMAMLFEKPSLRTRVSFEVGFARLGGIAVFLDHRGERIGARESIGDYGRNLERWCDVLVARTFAQATIEALAEATSIPVINALSDTHHPCQALADALTLIEHVGDLTVARLAWIGDGNNVCTSLIQIAALLGLSITVITPPGHEPDPAIVAAVRAAAAASGAEIALSDDPAAVAGHHAVYTDTWVSMGQADAARRTAELRPYQVDAALMAEARPGACFMHCLPAHRGDEVTDEVIDSPASVVFDQAENRMHAQNALLLHLLSR
jgi:ornithine carbamoyltransferase